jgi:large subunit ribosomal protein L29
MKIADIRGLSDAELSAKSQELRQERLNLRIQQQSGQLEKPSRLHDIRKTLARIETIASERRLGLKIEAKPKVRKTKKA